MQSGLVTENKERKKYLEGQGLILCGYCKYHRNENRSLHNMRTDKHKNIFRETIRRMPVLEMEDVNGN